MLIVIAISAVVGLVAFRVIKPKFYPYLVYVIALSLLLLTALASPYLVGTDIHLEYYFAQRAEQGWDSTLPHPGNSALGNVLLVPFLSDFIPRLWVFKVVFPLMFALAPVMLYFLFKSWVDEQLAFLSTFAFMSFPAFFIELPSIARQQLAEVFFALILLLIVVPDWKLRYKLPLVVILSWLVVVSHYSLGLALLVFLSTGFVVKLCLKYRGKFPTWALGLVCLLTFIGGVWYYGSVAGGTPLRALASVVPIEIVELGPIGGFGPVVVGRELVEEPVTRVPLMKAALGLDFLEVDLWGRAFRFLQFTIFGLLALGLFLLRRRKSYWVFASAAILILALCVLVPGFSAIMNATRFYHISLFLLAPAIILGGVFVFRNARNLTLCLLIPYFLFTSGLVFEVTGQTDVSKVTIPFSVALSDHRIDLGGSLTRNDELVRSWILENLEGVVYADFFGSLFLQKYRSSHEVAKLSEDFKGGYVFLRERNVRDNKLVRWTGIGLRESVEFDIEGKLLFRVGDAKVLEVEK